ncbi:MAG TPA: 2-succinyl-6-hydroxy-2,4-cyclohexadiene-1-carboxylate synthase [Dehalococcoidia bacterium]|nr:2-succinyl-6-hydroxy-2,4-cyclohexadiene-1-carboxylate synthase [Dehalococcoidia bacterium]
MTRVDVGGVFLNLEVAGSGPPVVLLHGFTGSAAGWRETVEALGTAYTTVAIDIIGHGKSDAPTALDHYRMEQCVDDLVRAVRLAGYERATWFGYSMGARTALQVAARRPEAVGALILESGSPGLATAEEREARVRSDEALAERIERDGVEAFVAYWEAIPLFSTQSVELRDRLRPGRVASTVTGLAHSLRGMGTGAQRALHEELGRVHVPVLIVTGELDTKFVEIGREMARVLPDATMQVVEGAGHAAHLERPQAVHSVVLDFLRGVHESRGIASGDTTRV